MNNEKLIKEVSKIPQLESQMDNKASKDDVARISSGTPKIVNSIAEMTDNTKNYVLASDKYVYQYNGTSFVKSSILYVGVGFDKMPINKIEEYGILSNNIYNFNTNTKGYLSTSNGNVVVDDNFYTSDFIEVNPNSQLVIKRTWYVAQYGTDKSLIICERKQSSNTAITTLSNTKYIRFSCYKVELEANLNQVNKGNALLAFDNYTIGIDEKVLGLNYKTDIDSMKNDIDVLKNPTINIDVNIPSKIYGVVGKEMNIYFSNIIDKTVLKKYFIDVQDGYVGGKHFEDKWSYTPASIGTFTLELKFFNEKYEKVFQKNISVEILPSSKGSGNKKALIIGDSTVASGGNTYQLLKAFEGDSVSIELLGSKGTAPNKHEGKDGRTTTYLRQLNTDNPFFNPTNNDFDFAYYMAQQNYTSVDFVFINLGINDVFALETDSSVSYQLTSTTIPNLNFVINSIKAYNQNIKIIINIPIPPNDSQDAFGNTRKCGETQFRYKRNNVLMQKVYIDNFDSKISNVYLCPTNLNINTKTDMSDHVHPKATNNFEGYVGVGMSEYFTIKSLS